MYEGDGRKTPVPPVSRHLMRSCAIVNHLHPNKVKDSVQPEAPSSGWMCPAGVRSTTSVSRMIAERRGDKKFINVVTKEPGSNHE